MLVVFKKLPLFVRHTFYYDLKAAMFFGIFGGAFLPFIAIVGRKIGADAAFAVSMTFMIFALVFIKGKKNIGTADNLSGLIFIMFICL